MTNPGGMTAENVLGSYPGYDGSAREFLLRDIAKALAQAREEGFREARKKAAKVAELKIDGCSDSCLSEIASEIKAIEPGEGK